MKVVNVYAIKSMMSHGNYVSKDSETLLKTLQDQLDEYRFNIIDDISKLTKNDFCLILVQSGGSEGIFKREIYSRYPGPYYLLTYGSSNSLAASLEIITFLKNNCKKGEVLHGNSDYIVKRIKYLYEHKQADDKVRLGVIGKPSDWLISSEVDYQKALDIFNIELVDISQAEALKDIESINDEDIELSNFDFDKVELKKALKIYLGLKKTVERNKLDGFTIRCFDIISIVKSSTCLGLALFNRDGIIASCEGDIPAMITAFMIKKITGENSFQANPQWIGPVENEISFAHCTLPLNMCSNYVLDTHFESGIGIGIHGEMKAGPVTIVKIGSLLNEFYCEEGELICNEYRKDRCRTQIKIKLNTPVNYFFSSSLGNHHLIVYGYKKEQIKQYLQELGLRNVVA